MWLQAVFSLLWLTLWAGVYILVYLVVATWLAAAASLVKSGQAGGIGEYMAWVRRYPKVRVFLWLGLAIDWLAGALLLCRGLLLGRGFSGSTHWTVEDCIRSGLETQQKVKNCDCGNLASSGGDSSQAARAAYEDSFHEIGFAKSLADFRESEFSLFYKLVPYGRILQKKLCVEAFARRSRNSPISLPRAVFIVSLPRTGSTWLHNLMELDPGARTMKNWELKYPLPCSVDCGPTIQERKAFTKKTQDDFYEIMPVFKQIHFVRHCDPDECVVGMTDGFFPEHCAWGCLELPRTYSYYTSQNMSRQYSNYKKLVQAAVQGDSFHDYNKMVFKSPHHLLKLEEIAEVFPGSVILWLHRDPLKAVGSCCSMNQAVLDSTCPWPFNRHELGRRTLERLRNAVTLGMAARDKLESEANSNVQFVDVHLDDLKADPVRELVRVYESAGLEFSDKFAENVKDTLSAPSSSLKGDGPAHHYSLSDFGISDQDVDTAFKAYKKRFST